MCTLNVDDIVFLKGESHFPDPRQLKQRNQLKDDLPDGKLLVAEIDEEHGIVRLKKPCSEIITMPNGSGLMIDVRYFERAGGL
ncbi:hypothetical protein KTR10_03305 [Candidatus Kaiserbacteria bacterium]|nr:hypothetical protein [Candidatus Kaiserbacteria bacterium]